MTMQFMNYKIINDLQNTSIAFIIANLTACCVLVNYSSDSVYSRPSHAYNI